MKNKYRIEGNVVYIEINSPKYGRLEVLIDKEDLELVKQYSTWHVHKASNRSYYINTNTKVNGKYNKLGMHNLIAGTPKGMHTDHIDGNTLNNCKENLRIVTCSQNFQNKKGDRGTASRFKGVSWRKSSKKWSVRIKVGDKNLYIGTYENEITAARMYDKAALKHYGKYARLNFSEEDNQNYEYREEYQKYIWKNYV